MRNIMPQTKCWFTIIGCGFIKCLDNIAQPKIGRTLKRLNLIDGHKNGLSMKSDYPLKFHDYQKWSQVHLAAE